MWSRIAQTVGALSKLQTLWKDKNIALSSKIRRMRLLVISIFLCASKTWTLTAELERKIQATEKYASKDFWASPAGIMLQMKK